MHKALITRAAGGLAASLVLTFAPWPALAEPTEPSSAYRLLVADAQAPVVRVLDLPTGRVIGQYTLAGPARLYGGGSSRHAFAVQGAAGQVAVIDTGIAFEGHGDHADLKVSEPRLLDIRLEGPKPSHFNRGGGLIATFFDGDGTALVGREEDALAKAAPSLSRLMSGAAHHGVAKPVTANRIALSVPQAGESLPQAIELKTLDGHGSDRIACPKLHGEGTTGAFTAFGCADGIAVYEAGKSGVTGRHLPYPASLPQDRMVRNLKGASGFTFLAGDFGPDGLVILDPSARDGDFRYVALPARRMHFDLHPEPGDKLYAILEDGALMRIDPLTGAIAARAQATSRYSMDQGVTRPRLAAVGPYVIASNPAAGEVVVLDAETLIERRRIKLEGAPFDLLAVGGAGATH